MQRRCRSENMFDTTLQVTQSRSQWWCSACLRELKLPQLMQGCLSILNSLNIKCTGWLVLFTLQGNQSSYNADMPGWHSLCTIVHSSNGLLDFPSIMVSRANEQWLWLMLGLENKKYIPKSCFNNCIALMSCMHWTGPLTFLIVILR